MKSTDEDCISLYMDVSDGTLHYDGYCSEAWYREEEGYEDSVFMSSEDFIEQFFPELREKREFDEGASR